MKRYAPTNSGLLIAARFNMLAPVPIPILSSKTYDAFDIIFLLRRVHPRTKIVDTQWLRAVNIDEDGIATYRAGKNGITYDIREIFSAAFDVDGNFSAGLKLCDIGDELELVGSRLLGTGTHSDVVQKPSASVGFENTPLVTITDFAEQVKVTESKQSSYPYVGLCTEAQN